MRRDDGRRRVQQRGEDVGAIEAALLRGPQEAGQDLLRVGAVRRAIPATTHLPCDDGWAQGLLGAPVGGIEGGIHQEAEDRWEFDLEMPREALDVRDRAGVGEHVEQLLKEMPARHVHAVRRDRPRRAPVAHAKGVVQDPRNARGQPRARMIALQEATPPQQMGRMPTSAYRPVCQLPEYADLRVEPTPQAVTAPM